MGDREEREEGQRKQYYGYTHKELAALPEWERDAIVRRRIEEDMRGVQEKAKQDSLKSEKHSEKEEDCFVASAVYGDTNAHEVNVLRGYRDNVLMKDELGKMFVEFYYSGAGKRAADFIKEKGRFLIPFIRKGLDFVVRNYEIEKLTIARD